MCRSIDFVAHSGVELRNFRNGADAGFLVPPQCRVEADRNGQQTLSISKNLRGVREQSANHLEKAEKRQNSGGIEGADVVEKMVRDTGIEPVTPTVSR